MSSKGIYRGFVLLASSMLGACATQAGLQAEARTENPVPVTPDHAWTLASEALRDGEWVAAQSPLAELVQQDLRNGHLQFLYALVQEQVARERDLSELEMAKVGYDNAVRFEPGHFWALMRLGSLALESGDWETAQARFAQAALDQPERWEAFHGLGVASYFRQDLALMVMAVQRGLALSPRQPDLLRMQAMTAALQADPSAPELATAAVLHAKDRQDADHFVRRVAELGQDYPLDALDDSAFSDEAADGLPALAPTPEDENQVVIEVTLLLSSIRQDRSRGVNLFDGLRVLYGYANSLTQVVENGLRQGTRVITSEIASPQLDYSLNLFNNAGQYYNVVARPSITAHLGRTSEFFAGRTINVAVSGLNVGDLKPIDVGVGLSVTPEMINGRQVRFNLSATRAFLTQELAGTFENSLTLFRQSVEATADVSFGQTLVLSAMSEQVKDKTYSKVPLAGDIPVLDWVTSRSVDSQRQESLLILVTPSLPARLRTGSRDLQRDRAAEALLQLWNERIEPRSGQGAIIERLGRSHWLKPPEQGDLSLRVAADEASLREAINESLLLARR